ncbi:MAG TPA: glycoside hydrolase family 55 protein [Acidobacteriaceae bacterium]
MKRLNGVLPLLLPSCSLPLLVAACLPLSGQVVPHTVNIVYPSDAGALNVKSAAYGAVGDGVTDDTAAIKHAIADSGPDLNVNFWQDKVVYFPNGTYLVSSQLLKQYAANAYACGLILMGESQSGVIIKLKDNATGYGNAAGPLPVILTTSKTLGLVHNTTGNGTDAYRNSIENLTINVGAGNPGAIAISYLANNVGSIRNVTLIAPSGSGAAGIQMTRGFIGSALLENVSINGFAIGMDIANTEYGVTMEHISLVNQTQVAVQNSDNELSVNYLKTSGTVPALHNNTANGLVVLSNSALQNGAPTGTEISNIGTIVFHKSTSAGSSSFTGGSSTLEGTLTNGVYTPADPAKSFDISTLLGLANDTLIDTPVPNYDTSGWISAQTYTQINNPPLTIADFTAPDGTVPAADIGDAAPAIQTALDAATATNGTVYLPHGIYYIKTHLTVPANVRRIVGMDSTLRILWESGPPYSWDPTNLFQGMFRVTAASTSPLVIERLTFDKASTSVPVVPYGVSSEAARDVVLRDVFTNGAYLAYRETTGGRFFIEDVCCGPVRLNGTGHKETDLVAARQFDSETKGYGGIRVINNGAPFWVLGLKTEAPVNVIDGTNSSVTQILGGVIYASPGAASPTFPSTTTCSLAEGPVYTSPNTPQFTPAAFILTNSWVEAAYAEEVIENNTTNPFTVHRYPYYLADKDTNLCINNSGYIPRTGSTEGGFIVPSIIGGPSTLPPLYP